MNLRRPIRRLDVLIVFLFVAGIYIVSIVAESLQMTSYYPSPYGSYKQIKVSGNTTLATDSGSTVKIGILGGSPTQKAQIAGHLLVQGPAGFDANGEVADVYLGNSYSWVRSAYDGNTEIQGYNGVSLRTGNGFTERVRVDTSGNLSGQTANSLLTYPNIKGTTAIYAPTIYTYTWRGKKGSRYATTLGAGGFYSLGSNENTTFFSNATEITKPTCPSGFSVAYVAMFGSATGYYNNNDVSLRSLDEDDFIGTLCRDKPGDSTKWECASGVCRNYTGNQASVVLGGDPGTCTNGMSAGSGGIIAYCTSSNPPF